MDLEAFTSNLISSLYRRTSGLSRFRCVIVTITCRNRVEHETTGYPTIRSCRSKMSEPTAFSSNNSRGDYFYFRIERGRLYEGRRLFEGRDYIKYFSQEVVP